MASTDVMESCRMQMCCAFDFSSGIYLAPKPFEKGLPDLSLDVNRPHQKKKKKTHLQNTDRHLVTKLDVLDARS